MRERYNRAAARLTQFGEREKRDVSATQAAALKLAEQGAQALDNQDFSGAITAYLAAEDTLQKDALALLAELEAGYASAAQVALKNGQMVKAKSQLEVAKQTRALKAEWNGSQVN